MKLSLEAIQIIDAIDRTGSMSGAADFLHRVPSTISYAVGKLEEQLNIKLFDRNGPKISLTAAGITLLNEGRLLLQAFGDLESRLHKIALGYESELRIVFDSLIPSRVFINDLLSFNALECGTRIRFSTETMGGVWEALREERSDIIIAVGDCPNWSGYQIRQIDTVDFAFCVSPDHPLAKAEQPLKSDDLYEHTVIVVADSARSLPAKTIGLLSGQKRITVPNFDIKIQFQLAGLGFGFLPRKLITTYLKDGALIELAVTEARPPEPVWLAMRTADKGEAASWWYKILSRPLLGEIGKK
ncbi:LysR family transcriptional regulator [Methylomonas sp. AM2-LC]|uniref:LysR family transcriptional regulator n=1 Tax=Methylomonas sp. AM2-LC TaxID=3153301 RepID=UPI0032647937